MRGGLIARTDPRWDGVPIPGVRAGGDRAVTASGPLRRATFCPQRRFRHASSTAAERSLEMGTETVQHGYMELASPSLEHPVLRCADRIAAALDDVADVDPLYLPTPDKAAALVRLARVE